MTATLLMFTPRVVKKAEDEGIEVASMDDHTVFGPVLHRLNFSDAIDQGLLTDYQVVVVGVDDARVHELIENATSSKPTPASRLMPKHCRSRWARKAIRT